MIYLDAAATSFPKPPAVAAAVQRAIAAFGNPSRGAHPFAMAALRSIEETRTQVAGLVGCTSPERVVFTKNATEALNIAVASLDGHMVSSEAEHNSLLRPLYKRGALSIAPVDALGRYAPADIARLCRPGTVAVAVAHASNLTGNLAPIAELGRHCRENNLFFIVDAAQTAGLVDIDMEALGIDALCFSGHKSLYGLQGTGCLCLSERFPARPLLTGGSGSDTFSPAQPEQLPARLEAGTPNSHGIASLSAGIGYVQENGPAALLARADSLARFFYTELSDEEGLTFYGDYAAPVRTPIVALNVRDLDSAEAAEWLAGEYGIAVRAGAHCAPLLHQRFGTEKQGALRFSFAAANTEEETAAAIAAVRKLTRQARA